MPPGARAELLRHAETCDDCRKLLSALTQTQAAGETELGGSGRPIAIEGTAIDRYIVRAVVGAGAMGTVYRAFDPRLQRDVALKLILRGGTGAFAARLVDEAHVLARLSHPNVVAIHDVGTPLGHVFLAVELGRETLGAWLRAGARRDLRSVLRLLRQAGEGLAAAHASGFIHRDIKPENVLIGFDGRALVTDFGLARSGRSSERVPDDALLDSPTVSAVQVLVGTPAYMAPEQLDCQPCDERSDQFSFCVMAFEALAGVRPFSAHSVAELRAALASGRVDRTAAARLPRWLRGIFLRGLRPDPAARWPSMRALLDALGRGPPLSRRRVVVATSAAVATALVLVSLSWGMVSTSRQRARAERRFNDVRHLATSFLFEFHEAIENLPGATRARELLVRRAQEYLDSLAGEASGDVDLQRDLASAYALLGEIQGGSNSGLGDEAGARMSLGKALAIREAVAAARPGDAEAAAALAAALDAMGDAHADTPEGLALIQRALDIRTELATRAPDDLKVQRALAGSHFTLAQALNVRGEPGRAKAELERAARIYERIAAASPGNLNAQRSVAVTYKYLGGAFERTGEPAAARPLYTKAVAIDEARVAAEPANALAKLDLSYSYGALAYNLRQADDLDGALALYRKALALRREISAADPANAVAHLAVARAHSTIATVLAETHDVAGALDANAEALRVVQEGLARNPAERDARVLAARVMAALGDGEKALAEGRGTSAAERPGRLRAARSWYAQSLDRFQALRAERPLEAFDEEVVANATGALAATDRASAP
jgi:serine/threonine protein kinase